MKSILLATTLLACAFSSSAFAAKPRINCTVGMLGCPVVHPTPVTPSVSPAPTASTPSTQDVFSDLLNAKDVIVAGLQQAAATQAAVLNSATSQSWEPAILICLNGMPTIGTPGQPGYIAGNGGVIGFVQGLNAPALANIPPLPDNPSPATLATNAQIKIDAALYDVNTVVSAINSGGFPKYLETDCGGVLAHINANIGTIGSQVAAFDALLAKFVMPIMAAHRGQMAH